MCVCGELWYVDLFGDWGPQHDKRRQTHRAGLFSCVSVCVCLFPCVRLFVCPCVCVFIVRLVSRVTGDGQVNKGACVGVSEVVEMLGNWLDWCRPACHTVKLGFYQGHTTLTVGNESHIWLGLTLSWQNITKVEDGCF